MGIFCAYEYGQIFIRLRTAFMLSSLIPTFYYDHCGIVQVSIHTYSSSMGLLTDTQGCRLSMRRSYRERFPRHRGLAIPTCMTCVTHVPWCMPGSLTSGRWREKSSPHSRHMRNPQFKVSGKRVMKFMPPWKHTVTIIIFTEVNMRWINITNWWKRSVNSRYLMVS